MDRFYITARNGIIGDGVKVLSPIGSALKAPKSLMLIRPSHRMPTSRTPLTWANAP